MSEHGSCRKAERNRDSRQLLRLMRKNSYLLFLFAFSEVGMDASSLHFPKPYCLQRTGRCPSAAVMMTPMQSRCPLVSGSQLLHHLSLYCEVSEKVKIFHYLVLCFQVSTLVPTLPEKHKIV